MRRSLSIARTGFALCLLAHLIALAPDARADGASSSRPGNGVSFGGEIRLRGEGFDNALDLADSLRDGYSFYRFRTRAWMDANPRQGLRIYFRLGNEYRWGRGEKESGVRDAQGKLSLDNGWAEVAIPSIPGASLRFGRQDLGYGEGFLIFDGTPADGSSSSYFDAMKLGWVRGKTAVDLLAIKIDDEGFGTPARDEDLFGVYAHSGALDLYTLFRGKRGETTTDNGTRHPVQQTTAIGGRAALLPETGWHLAVEGAYETGSFDHRCERAVGGYCRAGWTSPGQFHPGIEAGGVYLSGDDPSTTRWEGWDGFYSEWPKYSELYIYTVSDFTTRVAPNDRGAWTNLSAAWIELRARSERSVSGAVRCSLLRAPEKTGPGTGTDRGLLLAGQANVTLASGLQGQLLGEYLDPGDYYSSAASTAWYGRWQLVAKF